MKFIIFFKHCPSNKKPSYNISGIQKRMGITEEINKLYKIVYFVYL